MSPRPSALAPPEELPRVAVAMTVGENDCSGRAGVPMDLRAFASVGVHALPVLTGLRAAGITHTTGSMTLPEESVRLQLSTLLGDQIPDATKLGFLGSETLVRVVSEIVLAHDLPSLVLDPEMVTSQGALRLSKLALRALKLHLFPLTELIILNTDEARALVEHEVEDRSAMVEAARRLMGEFKHKHLLITGGRIEGHPKDLLFDGRGYVEFGHDRISRNGTRGLGAALSASVTAYLARGVSLPEAIEAARYLVIKALEVAPRWNEKARLLDPMSRAYEALRIDPTPLSITLEPDEEDPQNPG